MNSIYSMKFDLLHVYTLLSLILVATHAMSPQVYWNSVLPKTPMPTAIKDLLYTKAWGDGKEKVTMNTAPMYIKLPKQSNTYVASKDEVKDHPQNQLLVWGWGWDMPKDEVKDHPQNQLLVWGWDTPKDDVKDHPQNQLLVWGWGTPKDEVKDHPQNQLLVWGWGTPKDEVKDHPQNQLLVWGWGTSKDEVKDHPQNQLLVWGWGTPKDELKDHPQNQLLVWGWGTPKDELKDHPQNPLLVWGWGTPKDEVKDHPQNQLLVWGWDTPKDKVKDHALKEEATENPSAQLLFLENDLHQGKEMKLQFNINGKAPTFLPKEIANSIPFSSKDLPEIYKMFLVKPNSTKAKIMKRTISTCDQYKGVEGEEKFCATSLESMIDFATTILGKKVKALSTEKHKENSVPQNYTIQLVKKLATNEAMNCHRQIYPYAVFYCHKIIDTEPYVVYLERADGTRLKSMAVCHTNTSTFNPKHMAFEVLKVTPGVPICHFLLEDTVLWVPY